MEYAAFRWPTSANDFLAWGAGQTVEHAFEPGEVWATAGAGKSPVTVAGNGQVGEPRTITAAGLPPVRLPR